jgi:hypothetical protein
VGKIIRGFLLRIFPGLGTATQDFPVVWGGGIRVQGRVSTLHGHRLSHVEGPVGIEEGASGFRALDEV